MKMWSDEQADRGRKMALEAASSYWALGDLALEVAPENAADVGTALAEFGDEIGISGSSLVNYRRVAMRWPEETRRHQAPWSLHRDLAGREERAAVMDGFVKYCELSGLRINRPNMWEYTGKRPWASETTARVQPEEPTPPSVAQIQEALADPRVADQVLEDSKARSTVNFAAERRANAQADRVEKKRAADPITRGLDQRKTVGEMQTALNQFGYRMGELLRAAGPFPDGETVYFEHAVNRAEQAVQAARQYMETGKTPMDAALSELLNEGV